MHLALLGTNTQSLIDLLEEIFGDPPTDSDIEELEAPALKHKCAEAATAEQADATSKGECDPPRQSSMSVLWMMPLQWTMVSMQTWFLQLRM